MATLEELVVELTAETSGLRAELSKAVKATQDATGKMDGAIKAFTDNSASGVKGFEQALATMAGVIGGELVLGALTKLKDAFFGIGEQLLRGVEMAAADEQAFVKLANSLALTGQYSAKAMKDLQNFTEEMEHLTGIEQDQTASSLALLSTLTRLSSDGLKKAEKAAIDLSAAIGKDLNTATLLIAKGIQGNTEAFKRYGFEIQATGDKSQNLAAILRGLQSTQGAAEGQMQTFAGATHSVTVAFDNMLKAFGNVVVQNEVVIVGIRGLADALTVITGTVVSFDATLKRLAAFTMVTFINNLYDAVDVANIFTTALSLGTVNLNKLQDSLGKTGEKAIDAWNRLNDAVAVVKPTVDAAGASVAALTEQQKIHNQVLAEFANGLAAEGQAVTAYYDNELAMLEAQQVGKIMLETSYWDEKMALMQERQAAEQQALSDAYQKNLISASQFLDAKTQLETKQRTESMKADGERTKWERETNKQRLQNLSTVFGQIATLSDAKNKELAAIGKAAAITQATIDGILAVQSALANVPYPYNFVAAGLVGIAAAANVAKIMGVQLNKGGEVPGTGLNRDTVPVMATPGETMVDRSTTNKLKKFLDGDGGGGGGMTIQVSLAGATFMGDSDIAAFGAKVVEAINEASARGNSVGINKKAVSA